MGLLRITPPAAAPVDLDAVKAHLRITESGEDAYLLGLIDAATERVEAHLGRALITQTWRLTLDAFPATVLLLPRPPLQNVTSFTWVDADGVVQTLAPTGYQVDAESFQARVAPAPGKSWPVPRTQMAAVQVTFVAGWGDTGDAVPRPVRQAILLIIGRWYAYREDLTPIELQAMPGGADALLAGYRVIPL